jgi:hypothetical protein
MTPVPRQHNLTTSMILTRYVPSYLPHSPNNCIIFTTPLCLAFARIRHSIVSQSCSTMAEVLYERIHIAQDQSPSVVDTKRRKRQRQQPRQLLSCTKCRERKVKVGLLPRSTSHITICEIKRRMRSIEVRCTLS